MADTTESIESIISPADEHNRTLINNVHPPDWVNPKPDGRYNLVVVGAGTAGLVAAVGAAGLGAKVALVERHLMGGDCLNVGCVPSKAVIRSAHAWADVRDAGQYGIHVPDGASVDFGAVMERMRRLRAGISGHDSAARFRDLGVDVYIGTGRFIGPDTVDVDGTTLRFKKGVVATGARAFEPPIPGLAEAGFLTNESVFSLTECPGRLAVLGAGPLGCELAQTFQRLGCQVTQIEMAGQIMTREDQDAARIVEAAMRRDGVNILVNTAVQSITTDNGVKNLHVKTNGEDHVVPVDEILVGAGRVPNVDGLGLEAANVKYDARGGVEVDDRLRSVTNPNIFSAGDACLLYKFTHTADFTARIVIQNALFGGRKKQSALTIPWCTYTYPEVAHVGLNESMAQQKGIAIDTYRREMKEVDRAILESEDDGFVKIHVKKGSGTIVGATIVARSAGEMISEISVAMAGKVGLGALAGVIHPYPTQAEAIRQTGDLYNKTRLTPLVAKLFKAWLAWRR